jgi:Fe-S-cluster containining protein
MTDGTTPFELDVQPLFGRLKGTIRLPGRPMRLAELAWNAMQLDEQLIAMAVRRDTKDGKNTISCAKGCGACCRQLVPISPPEAWMIADVVSAMSKERRTELLARFEATQKALDDRAWGERELRLGDAELLKEQLFQLSADYFELRIPCAFLEDEACSIHPDRPAVCREFLATSPALACSDLRKREVRSVPVAAHLTDCLGKLAANVLGKKQVSIPLHAAVSWAIENEEDGKRTWDPAFLMTKLVEIINATRTG